MRGLRPNRQYGAHAHVNARGPAGTDAGGQHEPSTDPAAANSGNEIWLDFTTDRRGNAFTYAVQDWQFGATRPGSVVIHDHHTSHGTPPPPGWPVSLCRSSGYVAANGLFPGGPVLDTMLARTTLIRVALTLAGFKGRQMLLHPLNLLGLPQLAVMVISADWSGPQPQPAAIATTVSMSWGVPAFFVANLVATASARAGELLQAQPRGRTFRTVALCLATLGPAALCWGAQALAAAAHQVVTGRDALAAVGAIPLSLGHAAYLLGLAVLAAAMAIAGGRR